MLFKPLAGVILVLVLTHGCIVARGTIGEPLQEDAISAIKKGTTTMAEVVSLIGAPDRIVRGNDREIFHYYYYDGKSPAMLLILLNFMRMDVKSGTPRSAPGHGGRSRRAGRWAASICRWRET